MGKASRDKGARNERHLVRLLQQAGFAAEKLSRTGYTGHDVSMRMLGVDRRVEVKVRKAGFVEIYRWLDGAEILIVRADRREPLVIVPLRFATELATLAEQAFKGTPHH